MRHIYQADSTLFLCDFLRPRGFRIYLVQLASLQFHFCSYHYYSTMKTKKKATKVTKLQSISKRFATSDPKLFRAKVVLQREDLDLLRTQKSLQVHIAENLRNESLIILIWLFSIILFLFHRPSMRRKRIHTDRRNFFVTSEILEKICANRWWAWAHHRRSQSFCLRCYFHFVHLLQQWDYRIWRCRIEIQYAQIFLLVWSFVRRIPFVCNWRLKNHCHRFHRR